MKSIKFVLTGILFGIIMSKSEAISWYRIQEMFRFQSFLMYGIIGSAVVTGIIAVFIIKTYRLNDTTGTPIIIPDKKKGLVNYLAGGVIFGSGWALTGACPGPMFVLLGYGYWGILLTIAGALAGTYVYGRWKERLPH